MRLKGGRTGKRAVVCEQLELTGLMRPFDLEVWYGERVAVLGSNGSGKSHFLRLLAAGGSDPDVGNRPVGEDAIAPVAHTGSAKLGARVRPGWFVQTHDHPEQMVAGETPTHARLGISVSDVGAGVPGEEGEVPVTDGALVRTLGEGSTAEGAGLEEGDVITRIDDVLITSADSLVATIRSYRPGDEVEVTFERDGEEQVATLVLDSDAEES